MADERFPATDSSTKARAASLRGPAYVASLGILLLGASAVAPVLRDAANVRPPLPVQASPADTRDGEKSRGATLPAQPTAEAGQQAFMIQLGQFRQDQYLLDTRSGRVWQLVCEGKSKGTECDGLMMWNEMFVLGITPEKSLANGRFQAQIQREIQEEEEAARAQKAGHH